jgi:hypothetical protein
MARFNRAIQRPTKNPFFAAQTHGGGMAASEGGHDT